MSLACLLMTAIFSAYRKIWDEFCNTPGHIQDGSHVRKTCDHLLRFKEDVARERLLSRHLPILTTVMKSVGANAYRFSISWPRIIPDGGRNDPVNEQGLRFYDDLIDELVAAGIQPFVVSSDDHIGSTNSSSRHCISTFTWLKPTAT